MVIRLPKTGNPKKEIMDVLLKRGGATWTQVLEETKLSKGALSKHMTQLIEWGYVETTIDQIKRPPTTRYSLAKIRHEVAKRITQQIGQMDLNKPLGFMEMQKILVVFSVQVGYQISKLKDRAKAKEILREYLAFNLDTLAASLPIFVTASFAYSKGYMHKKSDPKKQQKIFIKNLKGRFMKEFVEPWIESLADTAFWNWDISIGVDKGGVYPNFGIEKGKNLPIVHSKFFDKAQELYERESKKPAEGGMR